MGVGATGGGKKRIIQKFIKPTTMRPKQTIRNFLLALSVGLIVTTACAETPADDGKKDGKKETPPEPRFKIYGWFQGGVTGNFASPRDNQNFGRLFDDRSNEPLLNQVVLTAERALDPKATDFDWGFKGQFLFGSDARFIHSLGIFDSTMQSNIVQPDLVEAYLNLHLPVITEGGMDVKLGKFVSIEGAETIDPRTNFFYSHTYIFNFGVPFNNSGALATLHAITDLNFIRYDAADASGGGIAQYFTYTINDWLSAGVRAEIWRDADNFFVVQYADNHDPMRALMGQPTVDPRTVTGGATTYGALTLGLNLKAPVPKPLDGLVIRPEIRGDYALNGNHPFNDSSDRGMFTVALSAIVTW